MEFVNDGVTDLENNPPGMTSAENTRVRRSRTKEPDMKAVGLLEPSAAEQKQMKYDSTGMYHWCPSRNINDCLMDRQEAAMTILQDHVIVAVFAEPDSPLIGLRNLVMPMRASNIHYNDLLHVVIIGDVRYITSKFLRFTIRIPKKHILCFAEEWRLLRNLPKLSVLDGSPLNRADLRAVKIDMCRLCVILSAQVKIRKSSLRSLSSKKY